MKYLKFNDYGIKHTIYVENLGGDDLGYLSHEKVGRRKRWVYVLPEVINPEKIWHTSGCLRQIADELEKMGVKE